MNYRTSIQYLVQAIQAAAICGFALRVVAAGSRYATFQLDDSEHKLLAKHIFLELDA